MYIWDLRAAVKFSVVVDKLLIRRLRDKYANNHSRREMIDNFCAFPSQVRADIDQPGNLEYATRAYAMPRYHVMLPRRRQAFCANSEIKRLGLVICSRNHNLRARMNKFSLSDVDFPF